VGADSFVAFFGIKLSLDPEDEDVLDACGDETDSRCVTAKAAGLQVHSGRMTDGEDYFLYVGRRLGWIGLQHDKHTTLSEPQFLEIAASVRRRLLEAGFQEQPELHLQLEAQY
jgi:hypothetical protein